MDGWIAVGILGVLGFVVNIIGRRERDDLRAELEESERMREALNLENFDLTEEVARYKGVLEAIAPADGEIWETKISHSLTLLDAQIADMVRAAGMRPWGKK